MTFLTAELDDFSPTGEGEAGAAITETTHAIAAAKLQRAVQRDIKEMLLRSKPYLQHTQAVAKVKLASLVILARPKPALLHPENALGFDDHTEYAKWKTGQLAAQRGVANHHREVNTRKLEDTQKRFQAYTDAKCQRKEKLKAEETAEAEAKQPHASASSVAYENSIKGHATGPRSSSGEAQGFLTLSKDLFTEDAWQGMSEMVRYASFIDSIEAEGVEERPGCEQCKENRQVLEKTWQVVANEYYDVNGRFSQREWAAQLLSALQESGGALRDKPQLTAAATKMIALLDDPYSEYLTPNRFRQALLRPSPVERDYLAAQSIGVGVKLGPLCAEGGRRVTAPLASSPAEGAGVVAGDRLLAIVDAEWVTGQLSTFIFSDMEGAPSTKLPTVLLVNRSSASASEVLAGALHDNGRALLIGEHTFGKGQIQYYFPLADDSGLKLTIAKYVTPARHDVSGEHGLEPDVVCRDFPHGGGGILRPVPVPRTALPLRLALSREAQVLSVRVWGGEAVAASALPSGNRQAQPSAASERQHWDSHGWLGPTWLVGLDWL
ncbi:MAG: hypothetical protein WDW38_000428 [Sanguina aurantia]